MIFTRSFKNYLKFKYDQTFQYKPTYNKYIINVGDVETLYDNKFPFTLTYMYLY